MLVRLDIGSYFLIPLARADRIISADNTTVYKIRLCIVRLTLDLYEHKQERPNLAGTRDSPPLHNIGGVVPRQKQKPLISQRK